MDETETEKTKSLCGKEVRLIKIDGFAKVGILKEINTSYVQIAYRDGTLEVVPFSQIRSVIGVR